MDWVGVFGVDAGEERGAGGEVAGEAGADSDVGLGICHFLLVLSSLGFPGVRGLRFCCCEALSEAWRRRRGWIFVLR